MQLACACVPKCTSGGNKSGESRAHRAQQVSSCCRCVQGSFRKASWGRTGWWVPEQLHLYAAGVHHTLCVLHFVAELQVHSASVPSPDAVPEHLCVNVSRAYCCRANSHQHCRCMRCSRMLFLLGDTACTQQVHRLNFWPASEPLCWWRGTSDGAAKMVLPFSLLVWGLMVCSTMEQADPLPLQGQH